MTCPPKRFRRIAMTTLPAKSAKAKKPFYRGLFFQVIAAIILGVIFGIVSPENAVAMKPLGDGFIKLIKMLIAPIIFCTMVTGIAGMGDMKQVGRVGAKAILMFEVITTMALIIGLVLVEVLHPGANMHIDVANVDVSAVHGKADAIASHSMVDFFLNMIPHTLVSAFSEGEILQVLLIALLFASALTQIGPKGKVMVDTIESFSHVLFKIVDIVTLVAPIGAFGAMAYTVGKFGVGSLKELGQLIFLFYLTGAVFIFGFIGPIMAYYCKLSTLQFLKYLREELLIVLGTSSSESVLPQIMEKLCAMGCSKPVVGLVIPASYSFNLVGSSIYFTMGALFIVNATGTTISFAQEMTLLGVLLITSKGAAGVTGSAFLVLAATLSSMNLMPQANLEVGLALIFAIDRFMSTGRAIVNLIGNAMTTVIIARWENELNYQTASDVLSGRVAPDLEIMEKVA